MGPPGQDLLVVPMSTTDPSSVQEGKQGTGVFADLRRSRHFCVHRDSNQGGVGGTFMASTGSLSSAHIYLLGPFFLWWPQWTSTSPALQDVLSPPFLYKIISVPCCPEGKQSEK